MLRTATIGDEGLKETCLKALYAGLVKSSRQTTAHTIQGINLMKNSAAEVFGLPGMEKVGYQAGFGYIRQLAVHLRNSLTKNSKVCTVLQHKLINELMGKHVSNVTDRNLTRQYTTGSMRILLTFGREYSQCTVMR